MAKFLFSASYTKEGIAGVLREGGSSRAKGLSSLADSVGGSIESMYWALGGNDFYMIAELPDALTAAALSAKVGASGAASVVTAPLFTADDVDAIAAKSQGIEYRAPGT